MKRLMLLVLVLVPVLVFSQVRPTRGGFTESFSASGTLVAKYVGGGEKDVTIISRDTDTDTLIVFTAIGDTAAARWRSRILVFPQEIDNTLLRFASDTLYIKTSGTATPVTLRVTLR